MSIEFDSPEKFDEIAPEGKRVQSTIGFPYVDMDAGIEVARAIYSRSGLGPCELDELAAEMGQVISGAFRLKTSSARLFELIEKEGKNGVKLSELGRAIVTPDTERAARAEAFMRVPLYSAIYEKYRGRLLPPNKALEREMLTLGVSSKQTDRARQAFEKSARQGGYFETGEDRLVRPKTDSTAATTTLAAPPTGDGGKPDSGEGSDSGRLKDTTRYHPFVQGLLDELPSAENFSGWSLQDQAEWLRAAASIFKLLSKSKGRITIEAPDDNENRER